MLCCDKLSLSNIGRVIAKTALRAGREAKINSRVLRRAQITALWQDSDEPSWRSKIAAQCGHSLDTASRYYEFSEKVTTGKSVIDTLSQLREEAEPTLEPLPPQQGPGDDEVVSVEEEDIFVRPATPQRSLPSHSADVV